MTQHQEATPSDDMSADAALEDPGHVDDGSRVHDDGGGGGTAGQGSGGGGRPRRRGGLRGILDNMLKPPSPVSRADAQREAAEELEQATTPAMDRLVFAVPGAGSPADALTRLEQSLPARDVPSEPPPAEHLPGAEVAETLALYQVRRHLKARRFPTAHEQELATRLKVGSKSGVGNGTRP